MRDSGLTLFASLKRQAAAQNFGWLIADRGVRLVLNVGIGFVVARHFGPERFGALAFAFAAVAVLQPLAEMGIDGLVRREFVRAPELAPTWAAVAGGLRLMGGALAMAAAFLSTRFDWAGGEERELMAVLTWMLLLPTLAVPELWIHARLAARASVLVQWLSLSAGALARLVLIAQDGPLVGIAVVAVAESLLGAGAVWLSARRQGFRFGRWDPARAATLLREAWPLMLSGFVTLLYMRLDVLMLRQISGPEAAGLYAAATRFTEIWFFIPGALAGSLLPGLLRAREAGETAYQRRLQWFYDLNAGLGYGLATLLALSASWLVPAGYGAAYTSSASILVLHAWSLVFVFLGVARGQFLVNERHTGFYFASVLAGLLLNVVLNLILIPKFGAWGAVWGTLAAQATAAWLSTFCFAPVRSNALMQTRAILIPFRWIRYVRKR